MAGARSRQAGRRPGAGAPYRRGPQLHRHLYPHGGLPAGGLSERARPRRRRHRRGCGPRRHRHQGGRPRRLRHRSLGRLFRDPRHAGRSSRHLAQGDQRQDRGGDDAEGSHRAIFAAPHLQGSEGRHHPVPCCGGRRRLDRRAMGSPRRMATTTSSITARKISSSASPRLPTARKCRWSTIRSARTPS